MASAGDTTPQRNIAEAQLSRIEELTTAIKSGAEKEYQSAKAEFAKLKQSAEADADTMLDNVTKLKVKLASSCKTAEDSAMNELADQHVKVNARADEQLRKARSILGPNSETVDLASLGALETEARQLAESAQRDEGARVAVRNRSFPLRRCHCYHGQI